MLFPEKKGKKEQEQQQNDKTIKRVDSAILSVILSTAIIVSTFSYIVLSFLICK